MMHGTETSIEYLQYTKFSENLERLLSSVCSAPGSLQLSPSTFWLRCHKLICLFTSFSSPPSHFPPSPPPPTRCQSSWATKLITIIPFCRSWTKLWLLQASTSVKQNLRLQLSSTSLICSPIFFKVGCRSHNLMDGPRYCPCMCSPFFQNKENQTKTRSSSP